MVGDGGYAVAITVMMILPIMAFTSVAVDLASWYSRAAQLQRISDAAALAAAPLLPDETSAGNAALAVINKNGISCTTPIVCTYARVGGSSTKYYVTIRDDRAPQFFSKPFKNSVSIERMATAERIKPVPMGSPRNFLGTNDLSGPENTGFSSPSSIVPKENFWLTTEGYCGRHEHGDRLAPRADAEVPSGGGYSCTPGSPATVQSNLDYDADGYFFGVEVVSAGTYTFQVFDAPNCSGVTGYSNYADESGGGGPRGMQFIVHDANSNDPLTATVLSTLTVQSDATNCTTYGNKWGTLTTVAPSGGSFPKTYYIQVKPVIPASKSTDESGNNYALRAYSGGSFTQCTGDPATVTTGVPLNVNCPKVFALTHLPIYASIAGTTPSFYLASVGSEHAGKTMQVELFDAAEKSRYVELLDPAGNPVTFVAEVACADGTFQTDTAISCPYGNAPTPILGSTYGPWTSSKLDICGPMPNCGADAEGDPAPYTGAAVQVWPYANLTQRTQYSDRVVRLTFVLPKNYATLYGSNTWWRIRYTAPSSSFADRTTWSVRIKGDPVRLVPNS